MADVPTILNASGDYIVNFDSDGDSSSGQNSFTVEKGAGGGGNELLNVLDSGTLGVFGPIKKNGRHRTNRTSGSGFDKAVSFVSGSTEVAYIDCGGLPMFNGGMRIPVVTSSPNGSLTGRYGQLIAWDDSGTFVFCLCTSNPSGTTWKKSNDGVDYP